MNHRPVVLAIALGLALSPALLLPVVAQQAAAPQPAAARDEVIEVTNTGELLDALGSNRVIRLAEGDYNLTEAAGREVEGGEWVEEFDGLALVLTGYENLALVAADGVATRPRILVEPRYADVLRFVDSRGIRMEGLTLGHTPQPGECTGSVLEMENCGKVKLVNLDLFGCGMDGLTLIHVEGLLADRVHIHSCTYGIAQISGCQEVSFRHCVFANCGPYYGLGFDAASTAASVEDCLFVNISVPAGESLFGGIPADQLTLSGNSIHPPAAPEN